MARFDVHRCRGLGGPYLPDNPVDVLAVLPTCLMIPLTPVAAIGTPTG